MKLQRLLGALCIGLVVLASPGRATEQGSYQPPTAGPMSMATFVGTYLNPALRALAACHNGSSAPANGPSSLPLAYQCWVDTTTNPALYKIYDGTSWIIKGSINTSTHVWLPYLTGGSSGGVPFFSTTGVMGASALLAQYGFVIGGGSGAAPATIAACTDDQIAFGRTSNTPLCRTVSGDITFASGVAAIGSAKVTSAMLRNSAAISVIGRTANSSGVPDDVNCTPGADGVIRESGSALGCGTIATGGIANNAVTDAKLRPGGALSLIGRSANFTGNVADISASAGSACAFRENGSTIACGTLATAAYAANSVTNAKLAQAAAYTIKGNSTGFTADVSDIDITALTLKASPVSGDIVLIQDSAASNAYKRTTVGALASAGSVATVNGQTGTIVSYFPPQGRLTLTSGVPVLSSTVAAATTVYYTPYSGNMVPIYDGTNIVPTALAELSMVLGSNWATNSNYDVFIASDSGTMRACTGPAWTSGTGRGSGAGTTEIARVSGLMLNVVTMTCRYNNTTTFSVAASRGTYVGSFRTGSAGQTNWVLGANGTAAILGVWNMYNRVKVSTTVNDSNSTWSYSPASAAVRQANASSVNQVNFIAGLAEDSIEINYQAGVNLLTATTASASMGIGLDSTSTFDRNVSPARTNATGTVTAPGTVSSGYAPQIGYHFIAALESGDGLNVPTFLGQKLQALTFNAPM